MVSDPEKEIRFTRSAQARTFALVGAFLIGIAITLLATAIFGVRAPVHPLSALPPLLLAIGAFWLAVHCARHAFLILSPVGIEFFPFFRPSKHFRVWTWPDFHHANIREKKLYLHFNIEETGGAVISLSPLAAKSRSLLETAINGRMKERFPDKADKE